MGPGDALLLNRHPRAGGSFQVSRVSSRVRAHAFGGCVWDYRAPLLGVCARGDKVSGGGGGGRNPRGCKPNVVGGNCVWVADPGGAHATWQACQVTRGAPSSPSTPQRSFAGRRPTSTQRASFAGRRQTTLCCRAAAYSLRLPLRQRCLLESRRAALAFSARAALATYARREALGARTSPTAVAPRRRLARTSPTRVFPLLRRLSVRRTVAATRSTSPPRGSTWTPGD